MVTRPSSTADNEARALRQRIDRGEDPLEERRKQEAASESTFKAICEEFFRLMTPTCEPEIGARAIWSG
jgi:hypothetical protein